MKRDILASISDWEKSRYRKPLILMGARGEILGGRKNFFSPFSVPPMSGRDCLEVQPPYCA